MSPKYYYSPLQNDEECVQKLLPVGCREDYLGIPEQSCYYKRKFWSKYWAWFTHGALVCSSTMLFVLLIQARSQPIKFTVYCKLQVVVLDVEPHCSHIAFNRNLLLAPANAAVEYNKEITTFNGTFELDSIYRGKPTPELDAAWSRVGIDGIIILLSSQETSAGLTLPAFMITGNY